MPRIPDGLDGEFDAYQRWLVEQRPAASAPQERVGARIGYVVPTERGWRGLYGYVVTARRDWLLVLDERYGVRRMIDREWLVEIEGERENDDTARE